MRQYLKYKMAHWLALTLPLKAAYTVAAFIAILQYAFSRRDRRIVAGNMRAVFPSESEAGIRRLTRGVFINFAKYLVDFFRFEKIDRAFVDKKIKVVGRENLDEALRKGKGVITLSAHIGNYELGGAAISLLGYKFNAVALNHDDKKVNDFFVGQRVRTGVNVIPMGSALKKCYNALRGGQVLALLGDRDFSPNGITTGFFGRKALLPRGPAAFYLKTGALIVPGFLIRMPDDSFELRFEKRIAYEPTGDEAADEKNVTDLFLKVIERYIRDYPTQWYMFRPFWL